MNPQEIQETLEAFRKAQSAGVNGVPPWLLGKDANSTFHQSNSATSGLTYYDLEAPAKFLVPIPTPLRNEIPRVTGKGGIQAAWRAINAINTSNVSSGVSGGQRGGVIGIGTKDYTAAYKGLGLESNVDFEADYAGLPDFDVRAEAALRLLQSLMLQEEYVILGGNSSFPINGGAATTTPTLADSSTGGALLNSTAYYVVCVALSFDALNTGVVGAGGVRGQVTRLNAGGTSDQFGGGAGKVSAEATITTSGTGSNTHTITASLAAAIPGAAGYAWYLGTATTVERIVAITTAPTVALTALPAAGNQLSSSLGTADNSTNTLIFDGLIYQALAAGSGAYTAAVGTTMTADNAGGIVEWDTALKSMYDVSRLGPDTVWLSSQGILDASKKILAGGSTGTQRFVFASEQAALLGGVIIREYLNKFTGQTMSIKIHPNMPSGMQLFTSKTIPYSLSNVQNVMQIRTRQEYRQIEWPLTQRRYDYGVYCDEVLQHYFPPSMALLYDVRPG